VGFGAKAAGRVLVQIWATAAQRNPQTGICSGQRQSYQSVSRETFWYDWAEKFFKVQDKGAVLASSDRSIFWCDLMKAAAAR
jgi:hypothetical protein